MIKKVIFFVSEDWYFKSHRLNFALYVKEKNYKVYLISNFSKYKEYFENKDWETTEISESLDEYVIREIL